MVEVQDQALSQQIELSGTITSQQHAQLSVLEDGLVREILVDAGDNVAQGQVLLRLDSTKAKIEVTHKQAELSIAKVQLTESERLLQEVYQLKKNKLVAQSQIEERKAAVAQAQANLIKAQAELDLAKEILDRHQLKAPFAGVIAARHSDIGEWVSRQNQVLQLVSAKALRLDLRLPQEYYRYFYQASANDYQITITPDALPNQSLQSNELVLVPVGDSQSRSLLLRVLLNDSQGLLPGMSATASINAQSSKQRQSLIPAAALIRHPDGGTSVFVIQNQQAKRRFVKVLEKQFEQIKVTGIENNAQVITKGQALLKDGDAVTLATEPKQAASR